MSVIETVFAREILDSRGKPTVEGTCVLKSGARGTVSASASVPSGASTGRGEALELRDGEQRYAGFGCRKAAANVSGPINAALQNRDFADQSQLDTLLLDLDGTENKSRLGANAILAVSLAFARACAIERGLPLYRHLAGMLQSPPALPAPALPRLTINLFSGGKHAGGQVPIQDVLVVPLAETIDGCLDMTAAVYRAAAKLTQEKYQSRPLVADEGGLAPPFASAEAMLADAVEAIERCGLRPGDDVALAVDVAATHFHEHGRYRLSDQPLDARQMIEVLSQWVEKYPIVSLEDGLAEDDWQHWPVLVKAIGPRAIVVGDDLLCTNPRRIVRAIDEKCATALLLKVNQIGTLTEAAEAARLARAAGWKITISARSGETEDHWLADLAAAWRGDQIKVGSITRSERLAKYNRLLAIEAETKWPVVTWPR